MLVAGDLLIVIGVIWTSWAGDFRSLKLTLFPGQAIQVRLIIFMLIALPDASKANAINLQVLLPHRLGQIERLSSQNRHLLFKLLFRKVRVHFEHFLQFLHEFFNEARIIDLKSLVDFFAVKALALCITN